MMGMTCSHLLVRRATYPSSKTSSGQNRPSDRGPSIMSDDVFDEGYVALRTTQLRDERAPILE